MKSASADSSSFQASAASAFSVATRAGGAVICLGYLLGLVQGPVVSVVGGLALITFGRNLLLDHRSAAVSGAALAVIAAALGIAALRWGALDLGELRGVQSVLGPTVLVGPTEASLATSIAGTAALVAVTVWMSRPWPDSKLLFGWWGAEAAIASLALLTLFFEPAALFAGGGEGAAVLGWIGGTATIAALAAAGGWLLRKLPQIVPAALMGAAGAAVAAAAAVLVTAL